MIHIVGEIRTKRKLQALLPAIFGGLLLFPPAMSTAGPNIGCGFASSEPGVWMACNTTICDTSKACTSLARYEIIPHTKQECGINLMPSDYSNWNPLQLCQETITYDYCGGDVIAYRSTSKKSCG